jgi:preprotein translocase subunit SecA
MKTTILNKIISDIKNYSSQLNNLNEEEFNLKIETTKRKAQTEPLENILIEWFGLTQEASYRTIGLRPFETQLRAGILLHEGNVVEMKTGEGKTLASTLPIALNGLSKKGVHVVTVNEYLAERDQKWMGKIYRRLGLTVDLVKSDSSLIQKRKSYGSDITYVTNSELVFDYLRDSSSYDITELVQRPFNFCIIDEIDSILIDEARTPLILSDAESTENQNKLIIARKLARYLKKDIHFEIDEKRRDLNLTELGYDIACQKLGKITLYDPQDPWILEVLNALKAENVYKINKDYVVLKNKVYIVDEFTGRIMEDRRWSLGIHEAIETKEKVKIGDATRTKSTITYQNFFTLYPKMGGMTGTAKTTEKEFQDIYQIKTVVVPTAKTMIRKDMPDLVYQSELAKWKAVLNKSKECFLSGQPLLIGTASVEKSEFLSDLFKLSNIPHQVLNAKPENVKRENEIVALAGEKNAITIATNMAGRGTDIILGGNPNYKVKEKLFEFFIEKKEKQLSTKVINLIKNVEEDYKIKNSFSKLYDDINNLPYSLDECFSSLKDFYDDLYENIYTEWKLNNEIVKNLGGLFVLGTERHETRRIDDQLRGRAGRQGDPGASQFFVSLEDDLIKIFGGNNIQKWVEYLIEDKDLPLESNLLTKSLENAQQKVELFHYDTRKNVFQYDDVLNRQRKAYFEVRRQLLVENNPEEFFLRMLEFSTDDLIKKLKTNNSGSFSKTAPFSIEKLIESYDPNSESLSQFEIYQENWIKNDLRLARTNIYQLGLLTESKVKTVLKLFDSYWTAHLERMSFIRETINWRAYGQQNPLLEYNERAYISFKEMLEELRHSMLYCYMDQKLFTYEKYKQKITN